MQEGKFFGIIFRKSVDTFQNFVMISVVNSQMACYLKEVVGQTHRKHDAFWVCPVFCSEKENEEYDEISGWISVGRSDRRFPV